jgi:hypothetical protein
LTVKPDPRVIFIIILNLKDPSLSGSDSNTKPNSLGYGSKKSYRKKKTNEEK